MSMGSLVLSALQEKSCIPTRGAVRDFLSSHTLKQLLASAEALPTSLESDTPKAVFLSTYSTLINVLIAV